MLKQIHQTRATTTKQKCGIRPLTFLNQFNVCICYGMRVVVNKQIVTLTRWCKDVMTGLYKQIKFKCQLKFNLNLKLLEMDMKLIYTLFLNEI